MNESLFREEYRRVERAKKMLERIEQLERAMRQVREFSRVRISSPQNCAWDPGIPPEQVKAFVLGECNAEIINLERQVNELYPDEG